MKHLKVRTVFISDAHLGSKGARAKDLARFLKCVRCDTIYLVGDILDCWRLRSRWYWPDAHNDVVRRVLKHCSRGTRVVFIPGNHDDATRQFVHMAFGGVEVLPQAEHVTADGRRLLVTHGDQYDLVVQHSRWVPLLGSVAYEWLLKINRCYNAMRQAVGLPYVSLSQAIKLKVKRACTFISKFEDALVAEARRAGMDGVVCGHIHKAEVRTMDDGVGYYNCGDWVESCTALVEHADGRLEIINGVEQVDELKARRHGRLADPDTRREPETVEAEEEELALPAGFAMQPRLSGLFKHYAPIVWPLNDDDEAGEDDEDAHDLPNLPRGGADAGGGSGSTHPSNRLNTDTPACVGEAR
ncbi:MAG: UDP-2,3-diacylglucosamine diphosphatase [Phycisphaerales bacterium JB063]